MRIAELIDRNAVFATFRVSDKAHALAEIAKVLSEATWLPEEAIRDALAARERLGSTGVGDGVALPHAWMTGVDRTHGLLARLARPVDFDAVDEKPVDLIFAVIGPESGEALAVLSAMSRTLRNPDVTAQLRGAADSGAIYEALIAAA